MQRLFTAAVLAPLLWVLIKIAPAWVFLVVAGAGIVAASWECYRMLEVGGARPFKLLGLLAVAALSASFVRPLPGNDPAFALTAGVLLAMLLAMVRRSDPTAMLGAVSSTVVPMLLVGTCLGYVLRLRTTPGEDGEDLVLLLFLCVILADAAAYYVGSAVGRHKMAPRVSPKKTWEGFAGGLLGSVVAALLAHYWFFRALPIGHAVILGLVLGAAGAAGDLAESVVKRAAGVKDSSAIFPGHGGLLDRTDSLLFAAPILYYYAVLVLGPER